MTSVKWNCNFYGFITKHSVNHTRIKSYQEIHANLVSDMLMEEVNKSSYFLWYMRIGLRIYTWLIKKRNIVKIFDTILGVVLAHIFFLFLMNTKYGNENKIKETWIKMEQKYLSRLCLWNNGYFKECLRYISERLSSLVAHQSTFSFSGGKDSN